ncbi:uncharacterized protein [Aegilops tauschii subsp. strangulata]|uniref:uncharacterized protein isoform X2 n=1 Tax=Aegilops tauschii subsp. strangulata TaxID=200361 RepID=UPI003CC8AC26
MTNIFCLRAARLLLCSPLVAWSIGHSGVVVHMATESSFPFLQTNCSICCVVHSGYEVHAFRKCIQDIQLLDIASFDNLFFGQRGQDLVRNAVLVGTRSDMKLSGTPSHPLLAWRMVLWATTLAMATLEATMMVRTWW